MVIYPNKDLFIIIELLEFATNIKTLTEQTTFSKKKKKYQSELVFNSGVVL